MSEFSSTLVHDILQKGSMTPEFLISSLMKYTNSTKGNLFLIDEADRIICKYSTEKYIVNKVYTLEELPTDEGTLYIAYQSTTIAIINLNNSQILESLSESTRQQIHDVICLSLILDKVKENNYDFSMSLTNRVREIIGKSTDTPDVNKLFAILRDILTTVNNAADYIVIDSEKIVLSKETVELRPFLTSLEKRANSIISTVITYDDTLPETSQFDYKRVEQMTINIVRRLYFATQLSIKVRSKDSFMIFEIHAQTDKNLTEVLLMDRPSMDNLSLRVVKRLCDIMHGTLRITKETVTITLRSDRVDSTTFKNRKIIISIKNAQMSQKFSNWLRQLGAIAIEVNASNMESILSMTHYDMVILDDIQQSRAIRNAGLSILAYDDKMNGIGTDWYDAYIDKNVDYDKFVKLCHQLIA